MKNTYKAYNVNGGQLFQVEIEDARYEEFHETVYDMLFAYDDEECNDISIFKVVDGKEELIEGTGNKIDFDKYEYVFTTCNESRKIIFVEGYKHRDKALEEYIIDGIKYDFGWTDENVKIYCKSKDGKEELIYQDTEKE